MCHPRITMRVALQAPRSGYCTTADADRVTDKPPKLLSCLALSLIDTTGIVAILKQKIITLVQP